MKQKIKKTAVGILAAAAVLTMGSVSTFAAGPGCGRYYADADKDGVCDHYEEAGQQGACGRQQRKSGGHHMHSKVGRGHGCRF